MELATDNFQTIRLLRNYLAFLAASDTPKLKAEIREDQDMNALFQSSAPSSSQLNAALLILRVASALAFLFHGSAILFGAFGGFGPAGFAAYIHMPVAVGYLVGLAQFAGGLAILSGVLFRVGAVSVIIVMLGAIFLVHVPHGFDIAKGGLEYALTQCLLAVAFLFTGPGDYSLNPSLPASFRKL
jgi:putative oxidoreductase